MKRTLLFLLVGFLFVFGISGCSISDLISDTNEQAQEYVEKGPEMPEVKNEYKLIEDGRIIPEEAKLIIKETGDKVIRAIANNDFKALAYFVHPTKGVRFTPYTYVSIDTDVVLNKDVVENFSQDQTIYLWGYYDGTGEEIRLTPSQYYEKFVYSEDFKNADCIGYNEVLSSGNMLENQFLIYERPIIVEYYFPGFNPEYGGMDWQSLRLVFEESGDAWKLVGIIHNQWTI